jgi:hypothetical protein
VTHKVIIEHPAAKAAHVNVRCQGKGCPLCASTAEDRARIVFVFAR